MLLTFLSRVMSTLLTSLLFVTVVGATANQTILNTQYLENKLASQKAYDRLSTAISADIVKNANDTVIPSADVQAALSSVLTPAVLQQKIDTTLQQLQAYYRGDGPVPTLDISELVKQAQQAGLQLDTDKYDKPVQLTGVTKLKKVSQVAKATSIGVLVVIGLLLLGVLAIAIKRRDFRPLANIAFSLGIMLSLLGAVLLVVPMILSKPLTKLASGAFGSIAHDVALSVIHDFAIRLLIPGIVALIIGIIAKILLHHKKYPKHLDDAQPSNDLFSNAANDPAAEPLAGDSSLETPIPPDAPTPPRPTKPPRKIQL